MKGEFEIIDGIRHMFPAPEGIRGIGDDCAIIPQTTGEETLVSTDMLVENSHFLMSDITPYQLGWKSAAANFSDIAAMGGRPLGSFLALAMPRHLSDQWLDEFFRGYGDISRKFGFALLGGDTTASDDKLCICITVLGTAPIGKSLKRSTAVPGDLVCVTGTLGDSAAGLEIILKNLPGTDNARELVRRHYLPVPRMEEGLLLAQSGGVHAMMDISDGIGSDLRHIMEESKVGMEIDLSLLPLSGELKRFCEEYGRDPYDFAADGGEDYQLLFTVAPENEACLNVPHTVIGKVTQGCALQWKGSQKDYKGFRHF